jgi:hypothetical protein
MTGTIKLGSLILTVEGLDEVTPNRVQYDQFDSYDGSFQVKLSANQIKEVSFKTSVKGDREKLLKGLDGKKILASSTLFEPFECVVATQKYSIESGEVHANYDVTLKEDKSVT